MLCWRFPPGGAQWQEPEPSSFLCSLAASWPSTRSSLARQLAPSSLGTGQGTCYHSGNVRDGREVTVLGEDKGMGGGCCGRPSKP